MSNDTEPRTVLATSTLRALRAEPARTAEPTDEPTAGQDTAVDEPTAVQDAAVQDVPVEDVPAEAPPARTARPIRKATNARAKATSPSTSSVSPSEPAQGQARRPAGRLTAVTAVLLGAAVAFAVVAGVVWWRAGYNSDRTLAIARDTVALDARLDVQAVNTSDYRQPAAAVTRWLSVSTGPLHDQFAQARTQAITLLGQAKIVTTAQVLDAAVTALDLKAGKATVIASVNVRKQPVTGAAVIARNRFRASLVRVGGQWKLSDVAIVSVSLS